MESKMFYLVLIFAAVTTLACTDKVKSTKVVDIPHAYSPKVKKACNTIKALSQDPKKYNFKGCMRELSSFRNEMEDILKDPQNLKETSN
ncbi:hypothetical protein N9989_00425 [bacterium]|jgi:hypothetical protein|nr:hypothetical protein [bacterium]